MVRLYKEDLIVYARWVRRLIRIHCMDDWGEFRGEVRVSQHEKVDGREVDLLVRCAKTKIIVELKDTDLFKALEQAAARRDSADYVYVAVDLPVYSILNLLKSLSNARIETLFENGIGIISAYDDVILFKAYHRTKTQHARDYTGLIQWLPDQT